MEVGAKEHSLIYTDCVVLVSTQQHVTVNYIIAHDLDSGCQINDEGTTAQLEPAIQLTELDTYSSLDKSE